MLDPRRLGGGGEEGGETNCNFATLTVGQAWQQGRCQQSTLCQKDHPHLKNTGT